MKEHGCINWKRIQSNRIESNRFCFVIARMPTNVDKTAFWISSMMYSLGVYVGWISYSDRNQLKSFNQNKNTGIESKKRTNRLVYCTKLFWRYLKIDIITKDRCQQICWWERDCSFLLHHTFFNTIPFSKLISFQSLIKQNPARVVLMIGYNDGPIEIPNQKNKKKIHRCTSKKARKKTINKIIVQCN